MTYIVHINPIPGTDSPRTIEVEATGFSVVDGCLLLWNSTEKGAGCFSPGVWIYVEPKK